MTKISTLTTVGLIAACNTSISCHNAVRVLAALLLFQLPADVPKKAEDGSSTWIPAAHMRPEWNSRFLSSTWSRPNYYSQLDRQPADEIALPLYLSNK